MYTKAETIKGSFICLKIKSSIPRAGWDVTVLMSYVLCKSSNECKINIYGADLQGYFL